MTHLKHASVIGFLVAVASLVTLLFQDSLFASDPFSILVQILAGLLMIWARWTFGRRSFHARADPTEGGLVTSGPYRYLRHPIYAAVIYFTWTGVFTHLSVLHFFLAVVLTAGLAVRMFAEERLVTLRYPEYADYAARTRRIIPFVL